MIKSILIVEDDTSLQQIFQTYIIEMGHTVSCTGTAGEAIKIIQQKKFDLIFTDKNLPGLEPGNTTGGMDILHYAKKSLPGTDVIMMTGFATIESAVEALKLGAFDYLIKPFELSELKRIIERYSEYKSFLNPQGTIELYKKIHNDAIDILNNTDGFDEEKRQQMLSKLEQKIDLFFKNQKRWEEVILQQRDALSNIAMYAEQFSENACDDEQCRDLISRIIEETHIKL